MAIFTKILMVSFDFKRKLRILIVSDDKKSIETIRQHLLSCKFYTAVYIIQFEMLHSETKPLNIIFNSIQTIKALDNTIVHALKIFINNIGWTV